MSPVRDDPLHPDPGFADLYARLPDATDLEPWLALARRAQSPVLYLGAGAGRLAAPLSAAGIELVLVDAHPGMVSHLRRRLPGVEVHKSLIETLHVDTKFDLVMVPSNILDRVDLLVAAASHLTPTGRLAFELTNPHWLAAGASPRFKVQRRDRDRADILVEYPDGTVQEGEVNLIWPEDIDTFLASAGLRLVRLSGHSGAELDESPTFYVVAERARAKEGISISEHIKKVPSAVRPTVQAARRTVKAIAPKADEIGCMPDPPRSKTYMWKLVRYAVDGANVVGIGTFPNHSNLFFYRGRELDDGSGLLQGGGKEMRSITLRSPSDAEKPAVKRLVRAAFKLGGVSSRP